VGVWWLGCGIDHPLQSSSVVKERVELYLYPPLGLNGLLQGELQLFLFCRKVTEWLLIQLADVHSM
jgi:hypothetical protein